MYHFKVTKDFTDLKDGNHIYRAGDDYPREGKEVDEERLAELSGTENKRGEALIVAVNDGDNIESNEGAADYPKHNGGGWYELSNGETVQGKEAALEAEAKLQK